MYKKLYVTTFILAATLFAGCKKDIKDAHDPALYSTSNYPASVNDLQSILAPCYSNLRDANLYGFQLLTKALANCTHTANSNYAGDPSWNEMTKEDLTITNSFAGGAYTAYYVGVKNCNVVLAGADFYMAKAGSAKDADAVNLIRGQALFLRAFYYFQLECFFGKLYYYSRRWR